MATISYPPRFFLLPSAGICTNCMITIMMVYFQHYWRLRRNTVTYMNIHLPVRVLFRTSIIQIIAVKKTMTWSPFEGVNCASLSVLPPLALMSAFSRLWMRPFIVTGIKAAYSLWQKPSRSREFSGCRPCSAHQWYPQSGWMIPSSGDCDGLSMTFTWTWLCVSARRRVGKSEHPTPPAAVQLLGG